MLGVVGVVFISLSVRWYGYREREDRPYGPRYVENYYYRYGKYANTMATSTEEQEQENVTAHIDTSILTYGTMDGT